MNRTRHRRRLIELRAELARARDRDVITGTLSRAAALFSPRVALFGVKREGLRGLAIPLGISGIHDTVTPISPGLEVAVRGDSAPERVRDLDLRLTVGLEAADPCVFLPVRVGERTVLMLYLDREGDTFEPDERHALAELCQIAGYSLEMLLRARVGPELEQTRSGPTQPTTGRGPSQTPPSAVAPAPSAIVSLSEPLASTTTRGRIEIDEAERDGPWAHLSSHLVPTDVAATDVAATSPSPGHAPIVTVPTAAANSPRVVRRRPTPAAAVVAEDLDELHLTAAGIDDAIRRGCRGQLDPDQLLEVGAPLFERIVELFPGELQRSLESLVDVRLPSEYGPLMRLCVRLGRRFGPHLLPLTKHEDVVVRRHAVLVFQELRDDRCVHALADRVGDDDPVTRELAMRVLETYHSSSRYLAGVIPIRARLATPDPATRLFATEALGTLRDVEAIAALVAQLDDDDPNLRRASLAALCSITGQQLGSKRQRWREWYAENLHRDRVSWLIDTLNYGETAVRRWAAQELVRVTGRTADPFPADGDVHARHAAISRWRSWWAAQGGRG